ADPSSFIGADAQITMANLSTSTVRGIVSGAHFGGTMDGDALYVLAVEPALVRARSFRRFASFLQLSPAEIIQGALGPFGIPIAFNVTGAPNRLDYETQWDESSLDFASRLMEREGLHYHFLDNGTTMVGDTNAVFGMGPALAYLGHFADPGTAEVVSSFRVGGSSGPERVTVRGWDYVRKQHVVGEATSSGLGEIFTFLRDAEAGEIADDRAQTLLARERTQASSGTGTSNSPGIRAGKQISVSGAGAPFNGSYVVTGVTHSAYPTESCFAYGNRFTAIPAGVPFQPEALTPVPRFTGTVPALVSTVQDTSDLYRVKVRFPWDPSEESNWARVAAVSGNFVLPEVGDEVLVAFDSGDLRFPVVIGQLWNGVDSPPPSP
ncbi:MAG: type VI secretion system Vgr family protein, partial [Vicinamibacteria bacterium]